MSTASFMKEIKKKKKKPVLESSEQRIRNLNKSANSLLDFFFFFSISPPPSLPYLLFLPLLWPLSLSPFLPPFIFSP